MSERKNEPGKINAFILNLMIHANTRFMNEYELADRIKKRFRFRPRPQEVRRYHLDPLIKRHWVRKITDKKDNVWYVRLGGFDHVRPEFTLKDQFEGITIKLFEKMDPEPLEAYPELLEAYIQHVEEEAWDNLDFSDYLTENEYNEYWEKKWNESHPENTD